MIRVCAIITALLLAGPLFAQNVTFKTHEIEGETVIFKYDLEGAVPGQTFEIKISIKLDGKEQELKEVTGDVGKNIKEGKDKQITWHAKKELLEFKGLIEPVIEAEVTFSPLYKAAVVGGNKLKRGKTYTFTWAGGVGDQPVNVELLKGGRTVATLKNNLPNNGNTDITIPKNLKSGSDYQLRALLVLNPTNKTETEELKISRSFPLGVLVAGGVAVTGAIVYLLLFSGDDGPDPGPETPDPLPEAPLRPDG